MKTLLAVDGNSMVNRAFFGVRSLTRSDGLPTNAVYGLITMLSRQVEKYSPDYCAVAFDMRQPTFRHKMYDGYKAKRHGMPDDLVSQMPYAHRAAEALGFHIIERVGYEADDVLGSLAAMAGRAGDTRTLILTGDRDSLQLIDDNTAVILATNKDYEYYGPDEFRAAYGIDPSQYVDVKALMGDSSDNIPGVSGIGEKGAFSLISRFGSLEGVYAGFSESDITSSLKTKLTAGHESALLSRTLATICREIPEMPPLSELSTSGIDRPLARELFRELEFGAFIKKFALDSDPAPDKVPTEHFGAEAFEALLSGKNPSVSLRDGKLTVASDDGFCTVDAGKENLSVLVKQASRISCHDCKSLYEYFDAEGVRLRGICFDVMLAAYVIDPQGGFDLPRLVAAYLSDIYSDSLPEAVYVFRLRDVIEAKLADVGGAALFYNIEMPLAGVLADMEEEGFLIDREGLSDYGEKLTNLANELTERIYFAAGQEFNINSPKQLSEVLFDKMGLPSGQKNKGKTGYSTSADILEKLAPDYPIVDDILEYRQLTKLIGTYVTGMLKVAGDDGRVHTSFKQTGTATGRLSSAEPNLQNIPIRTDAGRELRKYFIAREGCVLIDADYSQIELRLLASISGDDAMTKAFLVGADIHTSTASAVFGVTPENVTPELRKRAKAVNFGIVYGIGEYSLAGDLGISVKQAKAYIESYLASYPGVSAYLHDIVEAGRRDGYVTTLYGRRRYIPELSGHNANIRHFGERVAMNSPIQGSAADIIKLAMLGVSRRLSNEGLDARMILQVHDELIIEANQDDSERVAFILREEMENAAHLSVPLTVDLSVGERWFET